MALFVTYRGSTAALVVITLFSGRHVCIEFKKVALLARNLCNTANIVAPLVLLLKITGG